MSLGWTAPLASRFARHPFSRLRLQQYRHVRDRGLLGTYAFRSFRFKANYVRREI